MSKLQARLFLGQLVGRPAFVAQEYARPNSEVTSGSMIADITELRDATRADLEQAAIEQRATLVAAYGFGPDDQSKPFAFSNGYAMIPIHGALVNRLQASWGSVTGYNFIRNQLQAASDDPEVKAIVFDVNSYGGAAAGCGETADMIAQASAYNGGKPTIAVVDSSCFSGAYYLASQADHLAVTPSGQVGSIGAVMMHADMSKMLSDVGIDITFIHAGAHKVDGNPFEPLSDEVRADFQASVDSTYDTFVAAVAQGRGMSEDDVRATEARIYGATDALSLGLIDAIQNPADAVEAYFADDDEATTDDIDPPDQQEKHMPPVNKTTPVSSAEGGSAVITQAEVTSAAATAAADARTAERARIHGITTHAEAEGRTDLASHLALNTDMSVEVAAGILAAAPKVAAAAPPPSKTENETNHFKTAMDNDKHPNVGAGNEGGAGGEQELSPGQRILATQAKFGTVAKRQDTTRH